MRFWAATRARDIERQAIAVEKPKRSRGQPIRAEHLPVSVTEHGSNTASFFQPRPGPLSDIPLAPVSRSTDAEEIIRTSTDSRLSPEESVNISVGTGDTAKTFVLNRGLLIGSCDYFKSKQAGPYVFPGDDPIVFKLFADWVESPEFLVCYDPELQPEEPWLSNAAAACLLGMKLKSKDFEKYALSQFIQTCALVPIGPWEIIEREAPLTSPLRRFSNCWIAWNIHIIGKTPHEFCGLKATAFVDQVTASTRDPRILDINHWYSACGDDFNAGCDHDPISNQERLEEMSRIVTPPAPEWGRSFEEGRSGPVAAGHVTSSQPSGSKNRKVFQRTCGGLFCACLGLIFAGQIVAILVICVNLMKKTGSGIRYTTKTYSIFVGALGGLNVFVAYLFPIYGFFGFGAALASILDAKKCWLLYNQAKEYRTTYGTTAWYDDFSDHSCRQVQTLSILIWTSFPVVFFYAGATFVAFEDL